MESITLQQAITTHRTIVPRDTIARYYLKAEFPNIISVGHDDVVSDAVEQSIDRLSTTELWRLLEALSFTYRVNGVFSAITDQSNDWYELTLPISSITMTGTKPHINDIVYAEHIQQNPLLFSEYLRMYFQDHPNNDPQNLNDFRPRQHPVHHSIIMTKEKNNQIRMLDGTHRLIAQAMDGTKAVRAFSAIPNGKPHRDMAGDSSFVKLRHLYSRSAHPEQRKAIMETVALLARSSIDGRSAVETYWISHPRSEKTKEAGRKVISLIQKKS